MKKPYVISAELDLAKPDIVNPKFIDSFRETLDADLSRMGKQALWAPSNTVQSGMQKLLSKTELPVVSMDDRYIKSTDRFIGISRGVDTRLEDVGYVPRVGYRSIDRQLDRLGGVGKEVVLADDVLFSGEMISWLVDELKTKNIKVGGVVCGIAIKEGIEKLIAQDIDVETVIEIEDVEDEVCERDFAIVPVPADVLMSCLQTRFTLTM